MDDIANWVAPTGHFLCRNCMTPNITFRELGAYRPHSHVSALFRCFECDTVSTLTFQNDPDHNPRVTYQ